MPKDLASRQAFGDALSDKTIPPDAWPDGSAASPAEILALRQLKLSCQILNQLRKLVRLQGGDPDA